MRRTLLVISLSLLATMARADVGLNFSGPLFTSPAFGAVLVDTGSLDTQLNPNNPLPCTVNGLWEADVRIVSGSQATTFYKVNVTNQNGVTVQTFEVVVAPTSSASFRPQFTLKVPTMGRIRVVSDGAITGQVQASVGVAFTTCYDVASF